MELTVIPLVVSFLTVPLVYKYLTPMLTGGKVVLKQGSFWRYVIFGLCMAIAFDVLFIVLAVGGALSITPLVSGFVNSASEGTSMLVSGVFRGIIAQIVFFILTLLAGKFCTKTLRVEGKFNAWKAAWAPALVCILLMVLTEMLALSYFSSALNSGVQSFLRH